MSGLLKGQPSEAITSDLLVIIKIMMEKLHIKAKTNMDTISTDEQLSEAAAF